MVRAPFRAWLARGIFAAALFAAATLAAAGPDWRTSLTPDEVGKFPSVRPLGAAYRIGWTDIEAGRARVKISDGGAGTIRLDAAGNTTGLARVLWQIDATLQSTTARDGLRTIYTVQTETYAARSILTQIVARPDGIWRLRENFPPGENPARWKLLKISPARDLFSGLLFLRSQRLAVGDAASAIIFPGDSPFLVDLKVLSTGPLTVAGAKWDAIRLEIRLRRINLKKDFRLEPHGKFRNGTVWLSNDSDRIPLRVELELFIGYVFAELESVTFPPRNE
jgi:hypothetical protein